MIMGIDFGFESAKLVVVVASLDSQMEPPYQILDIVDVAKWEETATHIKGYNATGVLVVSGVKGATRPQEPMVHPHSMLFM